MLATLVAIGAICTATGSAAASYTVDRTTVISGAATFVPGCVPAFQENGAQIAVDPTDPRHLVATYMFDTGIASVAAVSRDRGATWTRSVLPGFGSCGGGGAGTWLGDPYLAIARDGAVYASTGTGTDNPGPVMSAAANEFLSTSRDGGATFGAPVAPQTTFSDQRGQLLADPAHPGRVTIFEEHLLAVGGVPTLPAPVPMTAYTSSDGGRTFDGGVDVPKADPSHFTVTAGLQRSGDAIVAFSAAINAQAVVNSATGAPADEEIWASRSTDGGASYGAPVAVGVESVRFDTLDGCCLPNTAAAPDGTLYTTWANAGAHAPFITRSRDGGKTWRPIPGPAVPGEVSEPVLAVRPHGQVGVLFYAVSGSIATPTLATSSDRGDTWQLLQLGPSFDEQAIGNRNDTGALGPYQGLAGMRDGFAAAFTTGGPLATGAGHEDVVYVHARDRVRHRR